MSSAKSKSVVSENTASSEKETSEKVKKTSFLDSVKKKGSLSGSGKKTLLPGKKYIRTIRILAFLIPFAAVLIGLIAGSFAPFGGKDVMTSGGMTQHLTYYYELYDRVHGGESLTYSLTSGTGYDFTTVFTYYLSDPLNLIILIFPRTAILAVLNLLYALKLGLAGLFMSIFLTHRKARIIARKEAMEADRADSIAEIAARAREKKEKAREKAKAKGVKEHKDFKLGGSEAPKSHFGTVLSLLDLPNLGFSVAFALSAYMVGQGLDVSHLSVVALFPLILMALDNLLENGKWRLYAALMTASVFCSFYMTIIVFIFSIIYTAVYDYSDLPHALRNILLKLMSDVLAAGAGAVIIFNSIGGGFFQKEISGKFPQGAVSTSFFDLIKSMMTGIRPSNTLYYGYGLDLFCGILALFLLTLYLFNPNISLRRKLSQAGILTALGAGLILVTPNYFFNGFFASNANVCFFAFLFIFQLLSMAYEAFHNLEHNTALHINLGAAVLSLMIILSLFFCDGYDTMNPFLVGLELLFIYYILLIMYRTNSMTKRLLLTLLPLILMGEIIFTYVNGISDSGSASQEYAETLDSRFYEASRKIHETETDARILYFDPEKTSSDPVTNSLLGYDYVITEDSTGLVDTLLKKEKSENGLNIYSNPYSIHGFYMSAEAASWEYDKNYPLSSLSLFSKALTGTDGVFQTISGSFSVLVGPIYDAEGREDVRQGDYAYVFDSDVAGDLYGFINGLGITHLGENRNSENQATFFRSHFLREKKNPNPENEYALFNVQAFQEFYNFLVKCQLTQNSSTSYTANINAPADGYLVLPISVKTGWSADNVTLSKINITEDLFIVPVTAGENSITLTYSPAIFCLGLVISLFVLAALILLAVMDKLRFSASSRAFQGVAGFIRENYVFFLTLGISTLVFVIMMCYTSSIPFGDNSPMIGDGYYQIYNGYRGIVNDVKNGHFSIVNWNMGIAIDRYADYASYFLSPWSLLKLLIIPDSMIFPDLIFGRYLSFVAPGLYLILYLIYRRRGSTMKKNDWRLIIIGVAYTLCSYSISLFVYSGFGFLSTAPLILLGMELLIYDKKPFLYIFMLFSFMGDAYYAFILCEFIFLYFFTMEFKNIKDMFMKGIRILIASVAAAGLACYRLIPYFFRTLDSPYKTNDVISPLTKENGSYISVFADTMGFHQPTTVTSNDFEANIYVGILVLFCIPLFLLNKKVPLSVRIRRMLLVVILFLGFGNSTLNYIFHGFHYQSMVPNRFAIFFVLLLFIMFYDCLLSWQDYDRKTFAISLSGAAGVSVLLWSIAHFTGADIKRSVLQQSEADISYWLTIVLTVVYLTFAVLQLRKKSSPVLRKCMIAILLIEIVISSFFTFEKSIGGDTVAFTQDSENINTLAARNPSMSKDFHATEYTANPSYNTAEYTNTTSISAFSSVMTNSHLDLAKKWGLVRSSNAIYYHEGNVLADMMLHLQYHLTNDSLAKSISPYPTVDRESNLTLHENPWYLPVGIFFSDNAELMKWSEETYSDYDNNVLKYHNAFAHVMGCEDIYHEIEPEVDDDKITDETKDSLTFIYTDTSKYEAGTSSEATAYIHIAADIEGDVYIFYNNTVNYIGSSVKGIDDYFTQTLYLPQGSTETWIHLAVLDKEELQKLYNKLASCTMNNATITGSSFNGTIEAPEGGMVYLSIPNMSEWHYTIDGQTVEPQSFLGGVGLAVTAGTHTIEVKYVPNAMWLGIGISITILVLLILFAIFRKKKKVSSSKA
ncbi:MAG: YfhO family protein [Eubacterium sp.]|nr:YfhO family protein [Eubacterium sp.]